MPITQQPDDRNHHGFLLTACTEEHFRSIGAGLSNTNTISIHKQDIATLTIDGLSIAIEFSSVNCRAGTILYVNRSSTVSPSVDGCCFLVSVRIILLVVSSFRGSWNQANSLQPCCLLPFQNACQQFYCTRCIT